MIDSALKRTASLALLAAVLFAAGCGHNRNEMSLLPTGYKPGPVTWTGGLTGRVFFDLTLAPDLAQPPYPVALVQIHRQLAGGGDTLVATDTLPTTSHSFAIGGLLPGSYTVVARSPLPAFRPVGFRTVNVTDHVIDVGDVSLPINQAVFSNGMELVGTMPGFEADQVLGFPLDPMEMTTSLLGVFEYPSTDYPPMSIPAGTYHFKFINQDPAILGHLDGWGGDPAETVRIPVSNHPVVYGRDHANDIVARFDTTGVYEFKLDERRQTFSIRRIPGANPMRLARREP